MAMRALYTAATGMTAQATGIDVIANNLANVNTTAFKRQQISFEDILYQEMKVPGQSGTDKVVPSGIQVGLGCRVAGTTRVFSQGSIIVTDRPFDLAIEGQGFFQVKTPPDIGGGTGYTRAGVFSRDSQGNLTMPGGYQLQPPIQINSDVTDVTVARDGSVWVKTTSTPTPTQVGQIELSQFVNPEGLMAYGQNIFLEGDASGPPINGIPGTQGLGEIQQGALEASNVDVVKELVSMIESQRAFEINSQVIQGANQALQVVSNLIRF
jgi:flagellar basal-body rod protein FlgG